MSPFLDPARRQQNQAAILAHELRQPLQSMSAALAVIRAAPDRLRQLRALDIADRQVAQVTHVVNQLQAMARATRSSIEAVRPVDFRRLLKDCVDALAIARPGHRLTCRLPPYPVIVRGRAGRLRQVCSNLLDNAAKFTNAGGRIHVSLDRTPVSAVLRVADTGTGIPPRELEHIFDLFVRGGSNPGAGIGLAVVRAIVAEHGGRIRAESDGPGTGSVFTITLPRCRPHGARTRASGSAYPLVVKGKARIRRTAFGARGKEPPRGR